MTSTSEQQDQSPRWEWRDRTLFLVDTNGVETIRNTEDIYRALVEHQPIDGFAGYAAPPDGLTISRYPIVPTLLLCLDDSGKPTISIEGHSRGTVEELSIEDLRRGHVVVGKTWFPIDDTSAEEVCEHLGEADASLGTCSLQVFLTMRKLARTSSSVEDRVGDRNVSALAFAPTSDACPRINATLYPYQLAGWRWLRFIRAEGLGGLLADEMGLGKTLQVIAAITDPGAGISGPCLVVSPGSILENWRREIARFAPELSVLKHHGPGRTGRPADLSAFDVVITSYDSVVRDNSLLNMIEWDTIILDEAQFIRNPDAQRTKAAKKLRRRVGIAVTGTPVENRLLDLWSIIDFLLPGQLGDRKYFESRYSDDIDGARLLEADVSPFMLRRRVAEVAQDLPPRIDIPQVIELSAEEAEAYDANRTRISAEYGAAATLVSLTELRRFCAHPELLASGTGSNPMHFSKFQRLDEILREIFVHREKVLVFTSFTAMADMIANHVSNYLHTFSAVIDGRTPIDDRQSVIDQFSCVQGSAVLVLNPRAGGSGLNITAANHVIHYNPEWNPALEDQASARAHRRGQELPVTVHRLLVADTVEDVINDRLDRKRAIADTAVVGVDGHDDDFADIVAALSRSPVHQT